MTDFRKQFWIDLEHHYATKTKQCEWCGKVDTLNALWDHAMYHCLLGEEKKFPRPEPEPTTEYCTKCGQEVK